MRPPFEHLCTLLLIASSLAGMFGCASRPPSSEPDQPFMGLADNEERRINDPESQLHGFVEVGKVQLVDHAEYRRRKASGEIIAEQVRGRFVYFAVSTGRHVPFDNASAYVSMTERFKAPVPHGP